MLDKLKVKIKFDHPVDLDNHRISDGGFIASFNDGRTLDFDFSGSFMALHCLPNNPYELCIDMQNPTVTRHGGCLDVTSDDFRNNLVRFDDFYVDTNQGLDTDLNVVEVLSCILELYDEKQNSIKEVEIPKDKLPTFESVEREI